ncbi:MAG: hypothetical protein FWC50_13595 [Planctomycetaceae bacterium]|nr:hypothetical protein [Planctomycetaceae bacterium]
MQNDSTPTDAAAEEAAKDAAKEAKRKKRARITSIIAIPLSLILICGWETLFLKNIPLLIAFLIFMSGYFLLLFWMERFKKCGFIVMLFVGTPCLLAYFFLFICVMNLLPVTAISERTTYLTEPRTPDGKSLDIPGAIAQRFLPDCPPEENGFREVVQAFGFRQVMGDLPENQRDDVARRLFAALNIDEAIDWNAPPQVKFESVSDFFVKHLPDQANNDETAGDTEKDRSHRVWKAEKSLYWLPWPEEHRDLALQWLAENNAALDRFGEAVRRPEYFVPFFQDSRGYAFLEEWSGYDQFHREMVRGLHLRMLHSLDLGDFDRAKHDLLTIARLGEKRMRHPRTIMNLFMASAIQGIALAATRDMLQYGHATHEQLHALQVELAPYQYVFSQQDVVFLMRMEGMNGLYAIGTGDIFIHAGEYPVYPEMPWYKVYGAKLFFGSVRYVGWTPVFRKFNDRMNALEKIVEMSLSPEQLTLFDTGNLFKCDDWFGTGNRSDDILKYILRKGVVQVIPDMVGSVVTNVGNDGSAAILSTVYRHTTMTRMNEIAFALAHYALDHDGAYPETLDALVTAGYLADRSMTVAAPVDPCTDGQPFHYQLREGNGKPGYLLYGIGINMRDDNGLSGTKVDPKTGEEHSGDDIAIEMP